MGRLIILLALVMSSLFAQAQASDGIDGLAKKAKVGGGEIVEFVKSGINEYGDNQVIKACLEKLDQDKNNAIYALFNYIMYLDTKDKMANTASLKETRRLILISRFAKKSVNYCNR